MYRLKIMDDTCSGMRSCGRCEELLPGFISKKKGEMLISPSSLEEKKDIVADMLAECPTSALFLDDLSV